MSTVRIEKYTMPAASLGQENPLPMLTPRLSATAGRSVHDSVPHGDRTYFGYGLDAGWLPHRGQDDYDRHRVNREFVALILENEFLKATILPEVGGRLWSLVHKPTGRELLHVNPVFQPANLGVRGAWVAGGVEWNACVYGHSPYNCSSMFAALVEDHHAGDVLRLYEWDRTRCVPYQLDFSLPNGSQFLFVRVRLVNPLTQTIPMYWWSNIAVPESPDVRVVVPAETAYTYEYWSQVHAVSIPEHPDFDITYSTNIPHASDYFFRIPDGARPWIAALDRDGRGLIQTSTARQIGRKLFAWGTQPGGRRWQEFLSTASHPYLEIQAGLSRTQLECSPMPAGAQWEWTEAYGLMEADPAKVHGADWRAAVSNVAGCLERSLPSQSLEAQLRQSAAIADRAPTKVLHRGSGWGALERRRREKFGAPPFCSERLAFDDESLGVDQEPWLSLLQNGTLPEIESSAEPGTWMIQSEWQELLEASVRESGGDHWLAHLHLGLMYLGVGNSAAAEEAWRRSLMRCPSGWAFRNLAVLCTIKGCYDEAVSYFHKAHLLLPRLRPLIVEYCESLLAANRPQEVLAIIESLPKQIRSHSRLSLLEARAGLARDLPELCRPILRNDYELVDIREGETSLTDMWIAFQSKQTGANNGRDLKDLNKSIDSPLRLPSVLDFQVVPHENAGVVPHYHIHRHDPQTRVGLR
jgi:tetratricopeptide (TPR) repeat protein